MPSISSATLVASPRLLTNISRLGNIPAARIIEILQPIWFCEKVVCRSNWQEANAFGCTTSQPMSGQFTMRGPAYPQCPGLHVESQCGYILFGLCFSESIANVSILPQSD
ncbi:hypothetical protein N7450_011584 [Penicillium hetheringtonii]|uniref:Uncharacterized protein n=1 Tax=Penicillium hetheringtonii TaxID=911720 RepID=A0AAD6DAG2_9EURO|nr:hypothetical protein N7450_011584 [Penicillium hetheringtonii]